MWQCHTNWPGVENVALTRVTSPGSAMTVSFRPLLPRLRATHGCIRVYLHVPRSGVGILVCDGEQRLSAYHFERHLVDVHRMRVHGGVVELPDLSVTDSRILRDDIHPLEGLIVAIGGHRAKSGLDRDIPEHGRGELGEQRACGF